MSELAEPELKEGRVKDGVIDMLQRCQECGRWRYTLIKLDHAYVCGNCEIRFPRKSKKERK